MRRHEQEAVMVRIVQPELQVQLSGAAESLDRIGDARDRAELLREFEKVVIAKFADQRVFVFEVEIDRGGRILDAVGNPSHRDRLIPLGREHFAGGVEDQGADFFSFPFPAFLSAQTSLRNLTMLSYVRKLSLST